MEIQVNEAYVLAENRRIETKRLILRPVVLEDAEDMFAYASDEETTKFVFEQHRNLMESKISIANYFMKEPLGKYAIEYKENHQMIGTVDLRVNTNAGLGELGYTLSKNYWGKGLMPEACEVLLQLGFEKLQLERIEAIHDLRNHKSGRVMEKIGMTKESTLYDAKKLRGEVVDLVKYSLSNKEWQQRKALQ